MAESVKSKYTEEEVRTAIALLEKTKASQAKQRERMKNNPEAKAARAANSLRLRIRNQIILRKAAAAGITVTGNEIDKAIATKK